MKAGSIAHLTGLYDCDMGYYLNPVSGPKCAIMQPDVNVTDLNWRWLPSWYQPVLVP